MQGVGGEGGVEARLTWEGIQGKKVNTFNYNFKLKKYFS
jgi:hypothetical protein